MELSITLMAVPRLRKSHAKLARELERLPCDSVFLNFSRGLEEYVRELAEGLPYEYVLAEIKKSKLVQEPSGGWEYYAEPILRNLKHLRRMKPELAFHCYESPSYDYLAAKSAEKTALMTLRTAATGKVDAAAWRSHLEDEIRLREEAVEEEAEFIASMASKYEKPACVTGLPGRGLRDELAERNVEVKQKFLDLPYFYTPLEMLKNELTRSHVSDEKIVQLVREHVDYVRKHVIPSKSLDEAYQQWVGSKNSQARSLFHFGK
ncbi:hypothetical protein [Candidatus Hecatella orcuttiae]|jgi:hypothetical protein|uniref:hypothetical protein n=1 Tax=Candidatus Hecatella orcuttiae TaxID=1935119 RepID=UPI002867F678|nr:hypothetical protein [Candidatus Hecatella orcuttiae]